MTSPKTVLVPLDGSAHATAALPVARGFAELLHATMAVLHVSDDALAPTALVERMKLSGADIHGCVVEQRSGAAAAAIVEEAGKRHAAMIVMCPQIRTDLPSRALGSVAAAWGAGAVGAGAAGLAMAGALATALGAGLTGCWATPPPIIVSISFITEPIM